MFNVRVIELILLKVAKYSSQMEASIQQTKPNANPQHSSTLESKNDVSLTGFASYFYADPFYQIKLERQDLGLSHALSIHTLLAVLNNYTLS